jgi:cytochrome b561
MRSLASPSDVLPAADRIPGYVIRRYPMPAMVFHWLTAILLLCMVASGVIAKQLGDEPIASILFSLHKLTGVLTLLLVLLRLAYRVRRTGHDWKSQPQRRPVLHWVLYGVVIVVPLLGWAGISDFGAREIFPGVSLPAIWPEGAGYDEWLLYGHAYLAFGLMALVALHIGVAIQDYMTDERPPAPVRGD